MHDGSTTFRPRSRLASSSVGPIENRAERPCISSMTRSDHPRRQARRALSEARILPRLSQPPSYAGAVRNAGWAFVSDGDRFAAAYGNLTSRTQRRQVKSAVQIERTRSSAQSASSGSSLVFAPGKSGGNTSRYYLARTGPEPDELRQRLLSTSAYMFRRFSTASTSCRWTARQSVKSPAIRLGKTGARPRSSDSWSEGAQERIRQSWQKTRDGPLDADAISTISAALSGSAPM